MILVTPRQAEVLSYLQGLQTVGEYLLLDRDAAIEDLELGHKSALTHMIGHLRDKGVIENAGGNLLRVLHRLESPEVGISTDERLKSRSAKNRRRSRRKPIIRYAGWHLDDVPWSATDGVNV